MTEPHPSPTPRRSRARPTLLVVGRDAGLTDEILSALKPLPTRARAVADRPDDVLRACTPTTTGIVVAPPHVGATPERILRAFDARTDPPAPRVFVVVPRGYRDRNVRELYRAGVAAVFEWPREALVLPRVVAEMLDLGVPTRQVDEDRALARAVRARLKLASESAAGIRPRVRDGRVALQGRVDSLWRKRRIEEDVTLTPGVQGVDSRGLAVSESGLPDREIARNVRALLRGATSVDSQTITATVNHGHAVLLGTAISGAERVRVEELVANVRGVRSVENRLGIEAGRKRRDRAQSRKLGALLAERHPGADIHVAVLGSVAVLTGHVELLAAKRSAEKLALGRGDVSRVVNKLEIRPAPDA